MKDKKLDILVLIVLLGLASLYGYVTRGSTAGKALFVGIAFAIPPMIYLSFRNKKDWRKIAVSTVLFGGLFAFCIDSIALVTHTWTVVSLVFPWKFLGIEPIDDILWFMIMTAYTVVFYEHFIDREKNHHISKNLKYAVLPAISVTVLLILIYVFNPTVIHARYPYFLMGIVAIIPPILLGFKRPSLIAKMALTAIYFFCFYFIYEILAVSFGWWLYSGNNYIGWVSLFSLKFPFEELFFWMMFYAASLVSYYEIFVDDEK